jgi:beta-phosphoglucomutase
MAVRAVIFDLDGVIVNTDSMHYQAWKAMADDEGIYFDERINDRLRGVSRMESLEIILERARRSYSEAERQALAEAKNARYVALLEKLTPDDVSPEALVVLESLRASGLKIAVGSSSRNTPLILKQIGLGQAFDAVADGSDITQSKPAPDVFLVAARRLGSEPAECIVVEDAQAGIEAAKAAGMLAAAIGYASESPQADYRLTSLSDLLDILYSESEASGTESVPVRP